MRVHGVFRHRIIEGEAAIQTSLISLYYDADNAYRSIQDKPRNPKEDTPCEWWTVESHGII